MSIINGQNADATDFLGKTDGTANKGVKTTVSGLIDVTFLSWKGAIASGMTTHDISTTTANVIAHGMGFAPKIVRLTGMFANTIVISNAYATLVGGNQYSASNNAQLGSASVGESVQAFRLRSNYSPSSDDYIEAGIAVDATNITITWSKTNTPTGTAKLVWDAEA